MKAMFFCCLSALMVTASPVLALLAQDRPGAGELALVVAAPFGPSIEQILRESGTRDAYPGRAPFGAFIVVENNQTFASLTKAGAILVLPGKGILALC